MGGSGGVMHSKYELLLACYRSGQISERQCGGEFYRWLEDGFALNVVPTIEEAD